ncbi:hypothetical protein CRYUN_Cryun30bG0067900 [Craigia yunnanensis]
MFSSFMNTHHKFTVASFEALPIGMKSDISDRRVMDHGTNNSEPTQPGPFSRTSSPGSSLRKRSLSISSVMSFQIDDDVHSETVSEAGDIGDRALHSNRHSVNSSFRLSVDPAMERKIRTASVIGVYIVYYPLGYFWNSGVLQVLTRYLLERLFGPSIAGVTSSQTIVYPNLPSNMVGSFLMGWWGVVFKGDISQVSDILAIGLTTGYLGSVTTFSGWNQKMLDLSVNGHWVQAVLGFLTGLFLAAYSIIFGIETAKGFRWILRRLNTSTKKEVPSTYVSGILLKEEFGSGSSGAQLWLACLVAPLGVWFRWFLARLNGHGLGKSRILRWLPFGTLIANVSAACIMAALSIVEKPVNTNNFNTAATGIQLGFLGCLSTVSTFIAEFNAMRESKHPWRAYVYALITMGVSFGLGILIYNVPVWTKGFT